MLDIQRTLQSHCVLLKAACLSCPAQLLVLPYRPFWARTCLLPYVSYIRVLRKTLGRNEIFSSVTQPLLWETLLQWCSLETNAGFKQYFAQAGNSVLNLINRSWAKIEISVKYLIKISRDFSQPVQHSTLMPWRVGWAIVQSFSVCSRWQVRKVTLDFRHGQDVTLLNCWGKERETHR